MLHLPSTAANSACTRKSKQDMILVLVFVVAATVTEVRPAKILLLGPPLFTHCIEIASLGKTLSDRGHSVWAFVPDADISEKCFGNKNITLLKYKADNDELENMGQMSPNKLSGLMNMLQAYMRFTQTFCSFLLGDYVALQRLREIRFDISIVNTVMRCFLFIPYKYNIPFVSMSVYHFWSDYGKPFHPTTENNPVSYSHQMTFLQKIGSTVLNFALPSAGLCLLKCKSCDSFIADMSFFEYLRLINKAELFIQDDDIFLFGAFPVLPNIIHTGGFLHRRADPLPHDLDRFYKTTVSTTHGVMLASFGSILHRFSDNFNKQLLECFTNLQHSVLWKINDKSIEQVLLKNGFTNIMTSGWIPQNDILGQNKTVLFISHCARKSFYEALYHGVPLICIPFSGDQPAVAAQVEYHQIGIKLDNDKVSAEILTETVREILSNSSYRKNMQHLSSMYRELHPETAEIVASKAIEHVIKYGGQHLRPQSMDLSLISHLMLDVWISLYLIFAVIILLPLYCCCRCCQSRSAQREKPKEKT